MELGERIGGGFDDLPSKSIVKQVRFSPDGSCLAVSDSEGILRVNNGERKIRIFPGGDIFDFDYYPGFSAELPLTQAVLVASRNRPINLYSLSNPESPLSAYSAHSFTDEIVHPISIRFSPTCEKIVGAFPQSTLRVWDVQRPGKQTDTLTFATRRQKDDSVQKGILSAIEFGHSDDVVFVGSYSGSIFGYDLRDWKSTRLQFGPCSMGGVVQLKYVASQSLVLSGHRKDKYLNIWDVRRAENPIGRIERNTATNQRFEFDVVDDSVVVSGDSEGNVSGNDFIKNTVTFRENIASCPVVSVSASKDGILACGSGVRTYPDIQSDSEDDTSAMLPPASGSVSLFRLKR